MNLKANETSTQKKDDILRIYDSHKILSTYRPNFNGLGNLYPRNGFETI